MDRMIITTKIGTRQFAARKETFGFLVVLGAAAALYLYHLGFSDIWADEAFTKAIIRHPLRELLRVVAGDFHPPLYFLALKFFTSVLGNTDLTIRLFSVLGALSTLALAYTAGRRVFGKAARCAFASSWWRCPCRACMLTSRECTRGRPLSPPAFSSMLSSMRGTPARPTWRCWASFL
jgi:hypothetical protein